MRKNHKYTKKQIEYLKKIAKGKKKKTIHEMFCRKFNVDVTRRSLDGIMYRNSIRTGHRHSSTQFKKGHEPWNKGKKGIHTGGKSTQFKKGNIPWTQKPIGSERVEGGIVLVKVADPSVWRYKHHVVWEQANGKIPDGYVIRFKDGNKMNVTLDNLFMTSHRACTSVVRGGKEQDNPELNVMAHKLAELDLLIKDRELG